MFAPLITAALFNPGTALAAEGKGIPGFPRKTMHGDFSERQVSRDLVLPKGWIQTGLALDTKSTGAFRNGQGAVVSYKNDTVWSYSRVWLNIDQGFSRRVTLYLHIPYVRAHLGNSQGVDTTTMARGDVHTGWLFQPVIGQKGKVAFNIDVKAPSGVEWPGDFIGGPNNLRSFLTGTGTTNLGGHVRTKLVLGDSAALHANAGYVLKFPSVVGYIIQPEGFGNGWLDPGDEIVGDAGATLQLSDDIAWTLGGRASWRSTYQRGTSGPSVWKANLRPIGGSSGLFVDGRTGVDWEPHPLVALGLDASYQLAGADTRIWAPLGLEEFAPQPGLTLGGRVVKRW